MNYLSLADLESFDPTAKPGRRERRFLCPFCHGDRKRDEAHRSLSANVATGAYRCHRCDAKGVLKEFWKPLETPPKTKRTRMRHMPGFATQEPRSAPVPPPRVFNPSTDTPGYDFDEIFGRCIPIAGTEAEAYLKNRSVIGSPDTVSLSLWARPCVGFILRGADGQVSGLSVRSIKGEVKKRSYKRNDADSMGAFSTPGAFDAPLIVITEAPIDALTLHACGLPAIATNGTACPRWLVKSFLGREIAIAYDSDEAGNKAATAAHEKLRSYGAIPYRLCPPDPYKDWNEAAQALGISNLSQLLASVSRRASAPRTEPSPDIPVYEPSMGYVEYNPPRTVVIAGRSREDIRYADPRVADAWAHYDRVTRR